MAADLIKIQHNNNNTVTYYNWLLIKLEGGVGAIIRYYSKKYTIYTGVYTLVMGTKKYQGPHLEAGGGGISKVWTP